MKTSWWWKMLQISKSIVLIVWVPTIQTKQAHAELTKSSLQYYRCRVKMSSNIPTLIATEAVIAITLATPQSVPKMGQSTFSLHAKSVASPNLCLWSRLTAKRNYLCTPTVPASDSIQSPRVATGQLSSPGGRSHQSHRLQPPSQGPAYLCQGPCQATARQTAKDPSRGS